MAISLVSARKAYGMAGFCMASDAVIVGLDSRTLRIRAVRDDDRSVEYKIGGALALFQWADSHDLFCMDRADRIFDGNSPLEGSGLSWENAIKLVCSISDVITADIMEAIKQRFKELWDADPSRAAFFLVRVAEDLDEAESMKTAIGEDPHLDVRESIMKACAMVDPVHGSDSIEASAIDLYGPVTMNDLRINQPGSWSAWIDDLDEAGMSWGEWLPYRRVVALLGKKPSPEIAKRLVKPLSNGSGDLIVTARRSTGAAELVTELAWWAADRDWSGDSATTRRAALDLLDELNAVIMFGCRPDQWMPIPGVNDPDGMISDFRNLTEDEIMSTVARTWRSMRDIPESADGFDGSIIELIMSGDLDASTGEDLSRQIEVITWPIQSFQDRMRQFFDGFQVAG